MSLYGFPKAEHLCGKNNFQLLFKEGRSFYTTSLKLVCRRVAAAGFSMQAGMVVPKKIFRHAVDRNRVKRLLREAYRLEKPALHASVGRDCHQWQLLFIYTGRELPTFQQVHKGVNVLLNSLQRKYLTEEDKKIGAD